MSLKLGRVLTLGILASACSLAAAVGSDNSVPLSTPPGIVLCDVMEYIGNTAAQFLWRRLGDETGKPLYTRDDDPVGKSGCTGDCAKEFTPLLADKGTKAFGDWTLVTRDDKSKQWAYQGKALYRFSGTDPKGEPVSGGGNAGIDDPAIYDPGSKVFVPKPGWKRAAYTPEKTLQLPAGIELKSLTAMNGYGFVTSDTGMPTYLMKTDPKDMKPWVPVYAALLASSVGDFRVVARSDGKRQWTYKGERLYTYRGDYSISDANGTLVDKNARIALAYRHFMPDSISINIYPLRGPLMTTADGRTVYTQTRYHLQYGGREMREGYRYTYLDAKGVGVKGCLDSECAQQWKPILAPAGARASGFWEVVDRPDGAKQWIYRGALAYTYVGDKNGGEINGNNLHTILYGDARGTVDLSPTGGDRDPRYNEGAGFYWHTAGLYY